MFLHHFEKVDKAASSKAVSFLTNIKKAQAENDPAKVVYRSSYKTASTAFHGFVHVSVKLSSSLH
jgi:hypothetical protein